MTRANSAEKPVLEVRFAPESGHKARVVMIREPAVSGAAGGRSDLPVCGGSRLWLAGLLAGLALLLGGAAPAYALNAIVIAADQDRIDLTDVGEHYEGRGDRLQIETAAGADGITGRMEVRALTSGTNPNWVVFALTNGGDKPVERWLAAERYMLIGSGLLLPDLDAARIGNVTPSLGFVPERIPNDRADIYRITVEPGQTVTFVAELTSERFPQLVLWKPLHYEKRQRDRALFNGIMLGIVGLIAVFLTAIFAANHKAIFPASALVAWSVLLYLCVDFGFWHKILQLSPEDNALYRAAGEAAIAASLVGFLYAFLRIGHWHGWLKMIYVVWIVGQVCLIAGAMLDPRFAATFARASFLGIGALGSLFIGYLALRGQDRALSLVPSWLLFLVWTFGSAMAIGGRLNGDIVNAGLVAGLVLILILMSFAVTQFAFRAFEPHFAAPQTQLQSRALAIDGAGAAVWEWNARRDEVATGSLLEDMLGLAHGDLSCRTEDWIKHLHSSDRDRFRLALVSMQERNGGALQNLFRMRRSDGSYRWFELRAATIAQSDQRALKCLGLIRDVTNMRRSHERLIQDAVTDNLTGLPNRELLLDRLGMALNEAQSEPAKHITPMVMFIDIDRFKSVNSTFGVIVGDSMLLNTAKRLARHIEVKDTLARVSGDQFAIMLPDGGDAQEIVMLADRVRRSLRSPLKIAGREIVLTASIGIAAYDGMQTTALELLGEAETAMYRAKRAGTDRIEVFKASMRSGADSIEAIESELRQAIERKQITILYQPLLRLSNEELAGFEVVLRWEHPTLGMLTPEEFMPMAERANLVPHIGGQLLARIAKDVARWQKALPRPDDPLFVMANFYTRQALSQEFLQEVRGMLSRDIVPRNCFRFEISEQHAMENPERTVEVLDWLKASGAGLVLDSFGTGYSSLPYLSRFAFSGLKLDRSLLHEATSEEPAANLVRAMVALAKELQKSVIAEGIETPQDTAFLRGIGCELGQGVYFGEPISDQDVIDHLDAIRKSDRRGERRGLFGGRLGGRGERHADEPKSQVTPKSQPKPRPPQQPMHAPAETTHKPRRQTPLEDHTEAPEPLQQAPSRPADAPLAMGRPLSHGAPRPPNGQGRDRAIAADTPETTYGTGNGAGHGQAGPRTGAAHHGQRAQVHPPSQAPRGPAPGPDQHQVSQAHRAATADAAPVAPSVASRVGDFLAAAAARGNGLARHGRLRAGAAQDGLAQLTRGSGAAKNVAAVPAAGDGRGAGPVGRTTTQATPTQAANGKVSQEDLTPAVDLLAERIAQLSAKVRGE